MEKLSRRDGEIYIYNGLKWLADHESHVHRVIEEGTATYPPSGSDTFCPELWKTPHWRYFLDKVAE